MFAQNTIKSLTHDTNGLLLSILPYFSGQLVSPHVYIYSKDSEITAFVTAVYEKMFGIF